MINLFKKTYITLLSSDDYLPSVLVLNESLKRVNSLYPLTVAVTRDLSESTISALRKFKINIEFIDRFTLDSEEFSVFLKNKPQILNTLSKVELFKLTNYDKLVYLDSDSIILKNIDDLFKYPDGSATHLEIGVSAAVDDKAFSGLMVFNPSYHPYKYYKTLMSVLNLLDGDLIAGLWYPVRSNPDYRIPPEYFACYHRLSMYPNEIKGVHFINEWKPWLNDRVEDPNSVLEYYYELLDLCLTNL